MFLSGDRLQTLFPQSTPRHVAAKREKVQKVSTAPLATELGESPQPPSSSEGSERLTSTKSLPIQQNIILNKHKTLYSGPTSASVSTASSGYSTPRGNRKRIELDKAKLFSALDKDGDGKINRDDFADFLDEQSTSRDVGAIFREVNESHDGKLSITEVLNWIHHEAPPAVLRHLQANFRPQANDGEASPSRIRAASEELIPKLPTKASVSEWFASAMVDAGVTHIYGGHGGALVPMVNAVVEHSSLTWVPTRNEANASLMAAAHAKMTGNLAVCMATSGPGATNLTTGLLEAHLDQCPVLALTGLKPREGLGYSEFQDVDQARLFAGGGLPFSVNVASPAAFVPLLRDAVAKAITQRTCVHLAVPVDVQAADCPVPLMPFVVSDSMHSIRCTKISETVIEAVARDLSEMVKAGQGKVLIAIGHRCIQAGPCILRLADKLQAPILTRLDAKGCVDESHPLVWGVLGVHGKPGLESAALLIETTEVVLSFGVHDCTPLLCNLAGMQVRPMIHFEPDGVAVTFNARYSATHTVIGNPRDAINRILTRLQELEFGEDALLDRSHQSNPAPTTPSVVMQDQAIKRLQTDKTPMLDMSADFIRQVSGGARPDSREKQLQAEPKSMRKFTGNIWQAVKTMSKMSRTQSMKTKGRFEVEVTEEHQHCHPADVFKEMSRHLGAEDVLCVDTGDVTLWASLCCVLARGQRTLASERMGTMGYALCAGIAASLVRGCHGRAVVVAGDGGIQMTCNELGTVRQMFAEDPSRRMIVVVFDNEALGRVAFGFKGALGCDLGPSPDFVQLARSYGGDGVLLHSPEQLGDVMRQAFDSPGLFLIHALVDKHIKADMASFKDNSVQMMACG